jgi:hypothetical protein
VLAAAAASVVACTLIVDAEWKDYGPNCQIPNIGDNVCGQCVTSNCQAQINANCSDQGNSLASSLQSCVRDPSPSDNGGSYCTQFLTEAGVFAQNTSQTDSQFNLRVCIYNACQTPCHTCVDIDAGGAACGGCIMTHCGGLLSGPLGCCGSNDVTQGIAECTDPHVPKCNTFSGKVAADFDAGDGEAAPPQTNYDCTHSTTSCDSCAFAHCVVTNCIVPGGPCQ